ncbi:hypothetical protein QEN19_003766 [Hanseniaspora menglaensis]
MSNSEIELSNFKPSNKQLKEDQATLEDLEFDDYYAEDDSVTKNLNPKLRNDNPELLNSSDGFATVYHNGEKIILYPLSPRIFLVKFQIAAMFTTFITLGLNDQATGNLIPVLESEYNVSQVYVSNIFLIQTFGYMSSCALSENIHLKYGQFGALVISSLLIVIPSLILFLKVKWFFVYVLCYYPIGLGIGLIDSIVNIVFGSMLEYKNELMAVLHGIYGCCSFIAPLLISRLGPKYWNYFFLLQTTFSGIGLVACFFAFRNETKNKYEYMMLQNEVNETQSNDDDQTSTSVEGRILSWKLVKKYPVIPLYALALFCYLGSEVGFGSWIYSYLLKYKNGEPKHMAYITSSFWFGLTVGRFVFGMLITRLFVNEYQAMKFFSKATTLTAALLIPYAVFKATSIFYFVIFTFIVFSLGAFIGPIFPISSIVAVELLDANVRLRGISVAISIGSVGGAILPYAYGIFMKYFGFGWFPTLVTIATVVFTISIHLYPKFVLGKRDYFYPT